MFKKIVCLILIILILYSPAAFAHHIRSLSPGIPWYEGEEPQLGTIKFAEEKIEFFLGMDYQIYDSFNIFVPDFYGIVKFNFDQYLYDGDFLVIVFNSSSCYYITPIIVDDCMACDFTNIEPCGYTVYIVTNCSGRI